MLADNNTDNSILMFYLERKTRLIYAKPPRCISWKHPREELFSDIYVPSLYPSPHPTSTHSILSLSLSKQLSTCSVLYDMVGIKCPLVHPCVNWVRGVRVGGMGQRDHGLLYQTIVNQLFGARTFGSKYEIIYELAASSVHIGHQVMLAPSCWLYHWLFSLLMLLARFIDVYFNNVSSMQAWDLYLFDLVFSHPIKKQDSPF